MRVLLTGARGFTGRFVAAALSEAGIEPVALEADLTDRDAVAAEVERTNFDRVIHLAGAAFAGSSDWRSFYAINQLGTLDLLDAIARKVPGARCILASSAQVYGAGHEGLIREEDPARPANHYAISKWAMELGASLWRDRLDIVVTRPFNYTGVGQEDYYLIPRIVDHFRRRADVIALGNTWVRREFGDVRSVAEAYCRLIVAPDPPPTVNLATGRVSSIDEVVELLISLSGHRLQVTIDPALVRTEDVPVLGGDASRLRSALPGWKPRQLGETLAWMYEAAAK